MIDFTKLYEAARTMSQLKQELANNNIELPAGATQKEAENLLAAFYWEQKHPGKPLPDFFDPMLIKKFSDRPESEQEEIWQSKEWYAEVKRNGFRIIWHFDHTARFNTRGRSVKDFLPADVADAFWWLNTDPGEWAGTVLDGEAISTVKKIDTRIVNGPKGEITNNVLQAAMACVSSPDPKKIQSHHNMPLRYVMYDILKYKGENVTGKTYLERRELLTKFYLAFKDKFHGRLILNDTTNIDKKGFFNKMLAQGEEGVVLKKASGIYEPGKRSSHQYKVKKQLEVDAIITGFVQPKSESFMKLGVVGGLKFSCKDVTNGKWYEVASISGLTMDFRKEISIQDDQGNFHDLKPEVYGSVYEIQGQEWGKNLMLANARIVRPRKGIDSKDKDECIYDRQAILKSMEESVNRPLFTQIYELAKESAYTKKQREAGITLSNGKYYLLKNTDKKGKTFTGFVSFPDDPDWLEEIDVVAKNHAEASDLIHKVLKLEYNPGGKIKHIEERHGLYF